MASLGLTHQTLSQAVYDELRKLIVSREIPPGSRLVERTLAEKFDVSRVPVREAMRRLVADGLIEERRRSGFFVTTVSDKQIQEVLEVSEALDLLLFRRVADRLDETSALVFTDLFEHTHKALELGETAKAAWLNRKFHSLSIEVSGSDYLKRQLKNVALYISWMVEYKQDPAVVLASHELIFAAVKSGSCEKVSAAIREHINGMRKAALSSND